MRVAITGSSGFLGRNVVDHFCQNNVDVVEISRSKGYDIADWQSVSHISPCDVIIHLAAKTFVPDSFEHPSDFYQFNLLSTLNALELARIWKARFIFMSSYLYGEPQYLPVDEAHPLKPHNPYAQTKLIGEEICKSYSRDFNLDIVVFRLFNVYGPGQRDSFLIPEMIKKMTTGKITLKDPRPKRDYIYVTEVAQVLLKTLKIDLDGYNLFNLGTGRSWSVSELVQILTELSKEHVEIEFTHEYRKGEVLDSVADVGKLKSLLNWESSIDLKKGLTDLLAKSV